MFRIATLPRRRLGRRFTTKALMISRRALARATVVLALAGVGLKAAETPIAGDDSPRAAASRTWRPVADEVYLQEVGEQIPTDKPVTAIAVHEGIPYLVVDGTVHACHEGRLRAVAEAPRGVHRLRAVGGALWAATGTGAYRLAGGRWARVSDQPLVDFCLHGGRVHAATREDLWRFDGTTPGFVNLRPAGGYLSSDSTLVMEDFSQVLADPVQIGPIVRLASYTGTLYVLRPQGLALIDGKTLVPDPIDWGALPSPRTSDLLARGSRLHVATDRGVGVLRGMAMAAVRGADGLPYEDTTCLAAGLDDDLWIGTTRGAIRQTGAGYHYFGAKHWLPGDHVRDIAVGDRAVYVATDAGVGVIRYEPYTLAKKAAYFERELDAWGFKRLGFIHKLYWGGDEAGWLREISDNDGGNTASYLAAMTFKYAATGDDQARHEAAEAFNAMAWLEEITQNPGFIARAVWSVPGDRGERSTRGSGGLPAKWYPTPDGLWWWKGDTSSDEVNGHFYAVSLFHDLAAKGVEKQRARDHVARIAAHIITNGWVLRDIDGKATRWGRWDPAYLQRPYGIESRGLNGMEAQTYMHVAWALTGDAQFQRGLEQLLAWRYNTYTVRQKLTFPPDSVVTWDDELAFRCYDPLLRYARDPELRSIYLRSLARSWEVMRRERVPFYNFIYGAHTGNDCEIPEAVQHLRAWSLDLVNHRYQNSHRSDLAPPRGEVPYTGSTRALSPRETEAKWGSRSALPCDGGEDGRGVTPPIGWLEDYWMGRYHGFIEPPAARDPAASSLAPLASTRRGAAPYGGPPRPPPKGAD